MHGGATDDEGDPPDRARILSKRQTVHTDQIGPGRVASSVESENREDRVVDGPELILCEMCDGSPESLDVDSAELFDEDPRHCVPDPNLGPERRRARARRRGCDEHDRAREERVGLQNDREPLSALFVSGSCARLETQYVTASHESIP